ncbi:MAG: HAMP domain-containing sensor histidine kinase [Chloroflexota bacterium]
MVEQSRHHNIDTIHILLDQALASDNFIALCEENFIQVIVVDSYTDLKEISSIEPDAIVMSVSTVEQHVNHLQDEAIVILAVLDKEQVLNHASLSDVDAIVPCVPSAIVTQIKKSVEQHRSKHDLQTQIANLKDEIVTRKRNEQEIELLKNAIVRNVSHELRTPLLQVKSAVALIGEDLADKKLVYYAQNAVSRLEIHIKNITMLGHSLDTSLSPIIVRDAIEYAKRNLMRIWTRQSDSERITVTIAPNLPAIMADKQGLSTVLQLLMDNALKFGKDNDIEVIARKSSDDKVYIAVRDNGIGIADDQLQYIFDSFYQIDDTSTRPYGGAGVGLALVKLILENHDAKIDVDSQLGVGSTFWFELPIANLDDIR